jgi:hypothetical protein
MKRKLLVSLFLLVVSGLATAQAVLPMPNIVDHQTLTTVAHGGEYTVTENIATAYNLVILVVTCDLTNSTFSNIPCAAASTAPVDQNGIVFTPIEYHYNSTYDWTEQEFYAVIPTIGSEVITITTSTYCSTSCTWKTMAEQVEGIQADQGH